MPMPTSEEMYENQSWIWVPSLTSLVKTVYLWDSLAVVDDGIWINGMSDNTQLDLEMPTLDLMEYIDLVVGLGIPGSQLPLLALGLAVDYNLYIDIDLDFDINNEGDIQIFYRPEPTSNGLY